MTRPAAHSPVHLATTLVACLCALNTTGCTLIGYSIGRSEDRKASFPTAPNATMARQETGVQVRVFLRDGTLREGPYGGLAPVSPDYEARYTAARDTQGPAALPALGERVRIVRAGGGEEQGDFRGFELGAVLVQRDTDAGPRSIPFEGLARLSWAEGQNRGPELEARLVAGQLPCRSRLLVGGAAVAVEDVVRMEGPSVRGSTAGKGALIGAALDIAVLVVAGLAVSNSGINVQFPNPLPSFATPTTTRPAGAQD